MAEMKPDHVLCGSRDAFAIECHLEFRTSTSAENWAGLLWFWIGGVRVGNDAIISLPGIAAKELRQTLIWCGQRADSVFYSLDPSAVLDAVDQGIYDPPVTAFLGVQRWQRFLICMLPGGYEYVDGWLVVMIEDSGEDNAREDRVLYRKTGSLPDREVWLPRGTYRAVVDEFLDWCSSRGV